MSIVNAQNLQASFYWLVQNTLNHTSSWFEYLLSKRIIDYCDGYKNIFDRLEIIEFVECQFLSE